MKSVSIRTIRGRIVLLEAQEARLALLILFPPPGCRNATVWREMQGNTLHSVRKSLTVEREVLAMLSSQLVLPLF